MIGNRGILILITTLLAFTTILPLIQVGAVNTSPEKQGDDVFGSVGPHTTLCEFADPDDCSESHFDSGTSAHIGDHEYAGSADPWAIYQVVLPQKPSCIDEDNLR